MTGELPVTASLGVAALAPGVEAMPALLALADDRLHEAEHQGRNRFMPGPT